MCGRLGGVLLALVARFAQREGKVLVLDHVLDLSLHGDAKQGDEVHDEDRPKHGDIEHLEKRAEEGDKGGFSDAVPELELWKAPHKGPELLIGLGGQPRAVIIIL